MAAASFTAGRCGGDRAPFPAPSASSVLPLSRRPAQRLGSVLAVSSDVLARNKAAHPVRILNC